MKKMYLIQEGEMTGIFTEISKKITNIESQFLINENQFKYLLSYLKNKKLLDDKFEWKNNTEDFYILSKIGIEAFEYIYDRKNNK